LPVLCSEAYATQDQASRKAVCTCPPEPSSLTLGKVILRRRDAFAVAPGGKHMVTVDDVRAIALSLPRAYEALVRDQVKFRVGRIVFASLSRDETVMGFGFPKDERAALVANDPDTFLMPIRSDERYNWVRARLAALDVRQLRELVTDAWAMCVPKGVARAYFDGSKSPDDG